MGRPKITDMPDVSQRLVDAFWELLKTHPISYINVSLVTVKAGCNRSSFYYHYTDLNDLVRKAIERELLVDGGLVETLFTRPVIPTVSLTSLKIDRISILMKSDYEDLVFDTAKDIVTDIWSNVLNCHPKLNIEVKTIVHFMVYGILHVVFPRVNQRILDEPLSSELVVGCMNETLFQAYRSISDMQEICVDEIISRFDTLGKDLVNK